MSTSQSQHKRRRNSSASSHTEDGASEVKLAQAQQKATGKRHKGVLAAAASATSVSSTQAASVADASDADGTAATDEEEPVAAVAERVHAASQGKPSQKHATFLAKYPGMNPEQILGKYIFQWSSLTPI